MMPLKKPAFFMPTEISPFSSAVSGEEAIA